MARQVNQSPTPNAMETKAATFLIALLIIQSASVNSQGPLDLALVECVEKEHVTKELAYSFGHDGNMTLAESNPNLKCFSACLLEKGKVLDGCKLVFLDKVPDDKPQDDLQNGIMGYKAVESCKNAVKSNERCECGFELYKCLRGYFEEIKNNN